jgi:translation initiation factor eIF-2B subunit gamma
MEFQAVLLAGGTGTRLYPLTEGVPKSLLPVANRPLIAYQLLLLEKAGFQEVLVATSKTAKIEIENYVAQVHKGSIQVDIHVVDEELETGDVLRALKDKIKRDFLVISGDLITDVNIHHLADVHRINDATCTVLLRAPKAESKAPGAASAKPGKTEGAIVDFVALDEKRTRLLCLESAADLEEQLVLPKALLTKHPNVHITNKMLDAHLYIFSRWVLDLLDERPKITSIKTELLPFLLRYQFSRKRIPGQPLRSSSDDADAAYDVVGGSQADGRSAPRSDARAERCADMPA